jgi:hypothetical protein
LLLTISKLFEWLIFAHDQISLLNESHKRILLNLPDRKRYQEGTNPAGVKWRYFGNFGFLGRFRQGYGQLSWESKSSYCGNFNKGVLDGKGMHVNAKGVVYDGEYKKRKRNGMAVFHHIRKKWRYEGQFHRYLTI